MNSFDYNSIALLMDDRRNVADSNLLRNDIRDAFFLL